MTGGAVASQGRAAAGPTMSAEAMGSRSQHTPPLWLSASCRSFRKWSWFSLPAAAWLVPQ